MITAILGAITSRKWAMELILAAVVAGLIWLGCNHLIDVGVEKERAVWVAKVEAANLETARQRGRAEAAETNAKREHDELDTYVNAHPLHGSLSSLCKPPGMPQAASSKPGNAQASPAAADFLALPEGNHSGDQGEPDQLSMLDFLARRADAVSGQLREYQSR